MDKYIVNYNIQGLLRKQITDKELTEGEDNLVVVVLDKSTNDQLYTYYNRIRDIILSKNKVILIIVGEESDISKPISMLMGAYRKYDIYKVESLDYVDSSYIDEINEHTPTYEEVQLYIGGDITAYFELNTILLEIDKFIKNMDTEGLIDFLEKNIISVSKFTDVVDYMKQIVDSVYTEKLRVEQEIANMDMRIKDAEIKNTKLESELETAKATLERYKKQETNGAPIIKTYQELNLLLINYKVKTVIYFKEISQIPYINSMVSALFDYLKSLHYRAKLLIYDNRFGMSALYKPLNVIGGAEYNLKADDYAGKVEKLVIVEPVQKILEDVLTYGSNTNEYYDVVIIYDRMKQPNDLVAGNNVYKFYVLNSNKDFKETQAISSISDKSSIITRSDIDIEKIGTDVLDIPKINGYNKDTDYAKLAKYIKAVTTISNKPLLNTILDKSRIPLRR